MLLSLDVLAYDLKDIIAKSDIRFSRRNLQCVRMREERDLASSGDLLLQETELGVLCFCESGSLLFEGQTSSQVLVAIQERFSFYNDWQMSLVKAILGASDWQRAVEILYSALDNPLYIVDRYGCMLGITQEHVEDRITGLWLECAKEKRLVGPAFDKMRIFPLNDTAEIVLPNDEARCNYIQCPLLPSDPYSRVLYILEWKHALDIRSVHLADAFQEILAEFHDGQGFATLSGAFEGILRGEGEDASALGWSLLQLGWQDIELFSLIGFAPKNQDESAEDGGGRLWRNLPGSVTMFVDGYALILVPEDDVGRITDMFNKSADSRRYVCGVSASFSDWLSLPERFSEVEQAIACGRATGASVSGYVGCGKSLVWLAARNLLQSEELRHPLVAELARHDEKNNTEFLRTLYEYLRLERKISATATELCVHRNTLLYRLQAIEKLAGFDWDDHAERIHFMLSYEALEES